MTNTNAKTKKRNDKGERVSLTGLKPHSRGERNSRLNDLYFEKTRPRDKNRTASIVLIIISLDQMKIYLIF